LFCLHEKGVPFTYHDVDMGQREHFSPEFLAINRDGTIVTMEPERGRWG
jgi:glutathione S-transferase